DLTRLLARHLGIGAELPAGADRRAHHHVEELEVGAIGELHVALHRILGLRIGGIRREEILVTGIGLINDEIRPPVGLTDQLAPPHRLGNDRRRAIAADRLQERAGLSPQWQG
ncbi:MAG: hypothetical protein ACK55I_23775, partial [bacterium]